MCQSPVTTSPVASGRLGWCQNLLEHRQNVLDNALHNLNAVPWEMQFTLELAFRRDYSRPHRADGEARVAGSWASHTTFCHTHLGIAETSYAFGHGLHSFTMDRALRRVQGGWHP